MIRLDSTLRKLQIVLGGAVTTNQLPVIVSYSDKTATAYTGGTQRSATNNTTQVDICSAPAASTVRDVDNLTVYNKDTATATVTILYDDNGTDAEIAKAVLLTGDQLVYTHGSGWRVLDASGAAKTTANTVPTTSAALAAQITDETGSGALVFGTTPTLTTPVLANPSFSGTTSNMGTVTTIDINGGTIDGVTIGGASRGAISCTTLDANGSATIGDATTDAHTFNGYVGINTAAAANIGWRLNSMPSGNTTETGLSLVCTGDSSATSAIQALLLDARTAASAFTVANVYGLLINDATLGSGSTITNQTGIFVSDQTRGSTSNFGVRTNITSGAAKWSFYSGNTAKSHHSGTILLGTTTDNGVDKFQNNGSTAQAGTVVTAGTTGNQTINKPCGRVNIAAAGTAITVTNNLVTANTLVFAVAATNDTTAIVKNVVPAAGSFTINMNAAVTAETAVAWHIINVI